MKYIIDYADTSKAKGYCNEKASFKYKQCFRAVK